MMAYHTRFSPRWRPALGWLAFGVMVLDFSYGGDVVLKTLLEILLFIGQAALTGWLAIGVLLYLVIKKVSSSRQS